MLRFVDSGDKPRDYFFDGVIVTCPNVYCGQKFRHTSRRGVPEGSCAKCGRKYYILNDGRTVDEEGMTCILDAMCET